MHPNHVQCKWYEPKYSNQYQCIQRIDKWKLKCNFITSCLIFKGFIQTIHESFKTLDFLLPGLGIDMWICSKMISRSTPKFTLKLGWAL